MSTKKPCPQCEEGTPGPCWTTGRKLHDECWRCGWTSEPYTPEAKPVVAEKTISVGNALGRGSWCYEVFDQYGYTAVLSRGYDSETECHAAAEEDRAKHSTWEGYGECVAIVWPPTVVVCGTLLKGKS